MGQIRTQWRVWNLEIVLNGNLNRFPAKQTTTLFAALTAVQTINGVMRSYHGIGQSCTQWRVWNLEIVLNGKSNRFPAKQTTTLFAALMAVQTIDGVMRNCHGMGQSRTQWRVWNLMIALNGKLFLQSQTRIKPILGA